MNINPFSSSFNRNPADAAMPYYDQVPETVKPYYDPYIKSGRTSLNELMKQYASLISNPAALLSQIGSAYSQSPGFQFQMSQGQNAINNAAAAGGTLGTPGHQFYSGQMASDLASKDFNDYLARALGLYQTGLGGFGGINQMGYGASSELAQTLGSNLMNQGNLAYAGAQHQNQSNADTFNSLLGLGTAAVTGLNNKYKWF